MNSGHLQAVGELAAGQAWYGWVGPGAIVAGVALLIVALVRRSRVTLTRKRRAANAGAAD